MLATLDLPDELLEHAMRLTNAKSQTQAIILALQALVKKDSVKQLKDYKGKIDLTNDINLDILRGRDASSC